MSLSDLLQHLQTSKDKMGLTELHEFYKEIFNAILNIEFDTTPILSTYEQLNLLHNEVMKRAIQLAEQDITQGNRPKKMGWVQFGSGAREEQTIRTDQDHGLLYQCSDENRDACASYVLSLAKLGTAYLHKVGYPYCSGNVMAINERWSKDAQLWLESMNTHIKRCASDDINYLFIAADLKGFYGDLGFIQAIKDQFLSSLKSSPFVIKRMHQHLHHPKLATGLFGKLLVEPFGEHSGKLNIKNGFYVPLVNAIKFLAITEGITASSTLERLQALQDTVGFNPTLIKEIFEATLYFRLRASLTEDKNGKDYLDLSTLTKKERRLLHFRLKQAKTFLHHVQRKVDGYG